MTSLSPKAWFGADPGGENNFGVALLIHGQQRPIAGVVSHADAAMKWLAQQLEENNAQLRGAGIDAPMWWSSGASSDRHADQWVRKVYQIPSGTVQAANSLRGAALVQAHMLALRLRENHSELPITEVHPKALLKIPIQRAASFFQHEASWKDLHEAVTKLQQENEVRKEKGDKSLNDPDGKEHKRDAIISAIAAREGFSGNPGWSIDLAKSGDRRSSEQDPATYSLAPMHYFWPDDMPAH